MDNYVARMLPRFRYGVIHPRSTEAVQRGPAYQLYRLVPLDVMEISMGLGLENYTPEGVEKALGNYWTCVEKLAQEKAGVVIYLYFIAKHSCSWGAKSDLWPPQVRHADFVYVDLIRCCGNIWAGV